MPSKGKIKWFDDVKGYGFITPSQAGEPEIFVHRTKIEGKQLPTPGQPCQYDIEHTTKGRAAANVQLLALLLVAGLLAALAAGCTPQAASITVPARVDVSSRIDRVTTVRQGYTEVTVYVEPDAPPDPAISPDCTPQGCPATGANQAGNVIRRSDGGGR